MVAGLRPTGKAPRCVQSQGKVVLPNPARTPTLHAALSRFNILLRLSWRFFLEGELASALIGQPLLTCMCGPLAGESVDPVPGRRWSRAGPITFVLPTPVTPNQVPPCNIPSASEINTRDHLPKQGRRAVDRAKASQRYSDRRRAGWRRGWGIPITILFTKKVFFSSFFLWKLARLLPDSAPLLLLTELHHPAVRKRFPLLRVTRPYYYGLSEDRKTP